MPEDLQAPYPYFGGKSRIAPRVWELLGDPHTYIEPFFGSGAVLLARPACRPNARREIINDADGMVANFWRAVQAAPAEVARYADWPCVHNDILPRRRWLKERAPELVSRMATDPEYRDPKAAGWWVWLMNFWIGGGALAEGIADGSLGKIPRMDTPGFYQPAPGDGTGCAALQNAIGRRISALADRLRSVKVVCGDWTRVLGGEWAFAHGCGIFLDPPYGGDNAHSEVYAHDSFTVASDVRAWCLENGSRPGARIILCGYGEEHDELLSRGWRKEAWKANGGYGHQRRDGTNDNDEKERLWISPACTARQSSLF